MPRIRISGTTRCRMMREVELSDEGYNELLEILANMSDQQTNEHLAEMIDQKNDIVDWEYNDYELEIKCGDKFVFVDIDKE